MTPLPTLVSSLRTILMYLEANKSNDFPDFLVDELAQFDGRITQQEQFIALAQHDKNDQDVIKCCMRGIARLNDQDYRFFEYLWPQYYYFTGGHDKLNELEGVVLDIWMIVEPYREVKCESIVNQIN